MSIYIDIIIHGLIPALKTPSVNGVKCTGVKSLIHDKTKGLLVLM